MKAAFVVLLACVAAAHGLRVETRGEIPCYPPGACANFGALPAVVPVPYAVPTYGAAAVSSITSGGPQVVLQSNAVDVETDGGFVISLPTPPPQSPDLPEFAEDHGPNSAVNKVIAHMRNVISIIDGKIAQKKQALADHDTWLEQASRAIERVKKQIRETKLSRAAIARNLKHLASNRLEEVKTTKQAKLTRQLEATQAKLQVLAEQHAAVRAARATIERKKKRQAEKIISLGKQLNLHDEELKAKVQLFEDQDNELAQIGQTPQNIRHIDSMLQDHEEERMAEI